VDPKTKGVVIDKIECSVQSQRAWLRQRDALFDNHEVVSIGVHRARCPYPCGHTADLAALVTRSP
jgi:hypothetical protein